MKIFCLEGEWEKSLKPKYSVESYLKYLDEAFGVKYIYRKVNSVASLGKYFKAIEKKSYKDYTVIYLAFHGNSKAIELDHSESINLSELAQIAGDAFFDRIIHFGSCKTLSGLETDLIGFKKSTKAKLITGYTKEIDFFESSLLDMAYLNKIVTYKDPRLIEGFLQKNHPVLFEKLGFKVIR